ncbi:MAG: hypothetical protein H6833_07370 [Planctomycetes bacterium]|nr:hypothetical protein [Planctomycetota bacterium]
MSRTSLVPLLLACLAPAAPAQLALTTLFAANNGGDPGGAVYFDLEVKVKTTLQALECNFGEAAGVGVGLEVYATNDTRVGKEGDPAFWDLVGIDDGMAVTAGPDVPTRIDLARPINMKPGRYGVALVAVGASHAYTNGNGTNQNHEDGFLRIEAGAAGNAPFQGGGFSPRVWNGTFIYGPKKIKGPFLYAYEDEANGIRAFLLDKKTGAPAELLDSPFPVTGGSIGCGGNCQSLAADPKGAFLFATTASGLSVHVRGPGGLLSEVPGSPFSGSSGLIGVGAWRKGKGLKVFAAANSAGVLDVFDIDPDTGMATLQPGSPTIGTGGGPVGVLVTKDFVYAVNQNDATLYGFAIDSRTGTPNPIPGSPFSFAGITDPFNVAVDPKQSVLVVNDCDDGEYAFAEIDKSTGAPLFPFLVDSPSACSEVIGFDKKGSTFFGTGDFVLDVVQSDGTVIGSPVIPTATDINLGLVDEKALAIYLIDDDSFYYLPLDKRTKLPNTANMVRLPTFMSDPTGMVYLKK